MPRYDFKSLSPQDFEELTRDILQAEWSVPLEAFKSGKDGGIDLRHSRKKDDATIIQCKHYAQSNISVLISALINSELSKVKKLNPSRYVLVTSLSLNPSDKQKIMDCMHPFIHNTGDVIGCADLDGLLAKHEEIEKRNFKLWFSNTHVLERILNHPEVCQTEFDVERIKNKIPLFVQSEAYTLAKKLLDEQRILVISGSPGIGKTTLAEMLLFSHINDNYIPIIIQTDIKEGKSQIRKLKKQIFYYDDFLGQTFLGDQTSYFGKNYDSALLSFMEMVRATPDSKFVLTTRAHILSQAFQMSERLQHSEINLYKLVLELQQYSDEHRARILYNHLYFSDLPDPYKNKLIENNFFLEIIKHKNFNPRLIEWLSSFARMRSPDAETYKTNVLTLLQSPTRLWEHAFTTQISDSARSIVLALFTLGRAATLQNLEKAFNQIHIALCNYYAARRTPNDFKKSLQECEEAFFRYFHGHAAFINPSIRDYVALFLNDSEEVLKILLESSIRFSQIANILELSQSPNGKFFNSDNNINFLCEHIEKLIRSPSKVREIDQDGGHVDSYVEMNEDWRLDKIISAANLLKNHQLLNVAVKYSEFLLEYWKLNVIDFTVIIDTLTKYDKNSWVWQQDNGKTIYSHLLHEIINRLNDASFRSWPDILALSHYSPAWTEEYDLEVTKAIENYRIRGYKRDLEACYELTELEEFMAQLKGLRKSYGIEFGRAIENIKYKISDLEESNWRDASDEEDEYLNPLAQKTIEAWSDKEIIDLFDTLKEQ